MLRTAALDLQLAVRDRGRYESLDALDLYPLRAGALDPRSHLIEQFGKVLDLRLLGGARYHALARCESGRHHHILGAGDGHLFKIDIVPNEPPLRSAGNDVARLK